MNTYSKYMTLAFQWGILLGLAVWGGIQADKKLGFAALFVILLPLVALAYLFYSLLKNFGKKN